jgi:phospholipid transport system transporter-binding protein
VTQAQIIALGAGRFAVRGELSFATAAAVLRQSLPMFDGYREIDIDLAGVTVADSAGLALVLEWLRQGRLQGRGIRLGHAPEALLDIAALSHVAPLLGAETT